MFLSFVDLAFSPRTPPVTTAYAHTLCTNRDLAAELLAGTPLQLDEPAPVKRIACLHAPTRTSYPPLSGHALWALVSNLSLNHLSLSHGAHSLEALREVLRLYSLSDRLSTHQQVDGIRKLDCRPVVRRIGHDAWRGFCHGTEVTITLDESMYVGSSPVLFASVLNQFFALYTSINSFTELVLRSYERDFEWKRFAPQGGLQPLF
jgi:type VI secretion system protein ImpG